MAGARGRPAVRLRCLGVQGHDCARVWRVVSFNGLKQAYCLGADFDLPCSRRIRGVGGFSAGKRKLVVLSLVFQRIYCATCTNPLCLPANSSVYES